MAAWEGDGHDAPFQSTHELLPFELLPFEPLPHYSDLCGTNIAIFGLSANPPTGYSGHTGIMQYLYGCGAFDEIWILPVYQHIFDAKRCMESFEDRSNMLELCVEAIMLDGNLPAALSTVGNNRSLGDDSSTYQCKLRVLSLEKTASEYYRSLYGDSYRVGTIDVLDYINMHYEGLGANTNRHSDSRTNSNDIDIECFDGSGPGVDVDHRHGLSLSLILGMDTFVDFCSMKWKRADRIVNVVQSFHVINRQGVDPPLSSSSSSAIPTDPYKSSTINMAAAVAHKVHYHSIPFLDDVSSSQVRSLIRAYTSAASTSTPDTVADVIPDTANAIYDHHHHHHQAEGLLIGLQRYLYRSVVDYIVSHGLYGLDDVD